jgi:signal peptidase II
MVKKVKKKVYLISLIGLIIDFLTKLFISSKLSLGQSKTIINNFFSLTLVHNKGAAWGLLFNKVNLLLIISIVFLVLFIYMIEKNELKKYEEISYGLIIAGVVGNMIDRLFRGYVIDFLDFNIFGYNYPVFNIADTLIVTGVIIVIVFYIKELFVKWKKD